MNKVIATLILLIFPSWAWAAHAFLGVYLEAFAFLLFVILPIFIWILSLIFDNRKAVVIFLVVAQPIIINISFSNYNGNYEVYLFWILEFISPFIISYYFPRRKTFKQAWQALKLEITQG